MGPCLCRTFSSGGGTTLETLGVEERIGFRLVLFHLYCLPDQVAALSQAKKEHAIEVAKLKSILKELEEKHFVEKVQKDNLIIEANGLFSSLCALEADGSRIKKHNEELEKEISEAIWRNEDLKRRIILKEDEVKKEKKKHSEYLKKIESYKSEFSQYESSNPVRFELDKVKKETEELTTRKQQLEEQIKKWDSEISYSNKSDVEIRSSIEGIEASVEEKKIINNNIMQQFETHQQERQRLEIDNHILKKKNSALLTRLKRQVEEQKIKYHQSIGYNKNFTMSKNSSTRELETENQN
ncbi:uncharacterized protein LOC131958379 [Physella acuta]|uniref:uncharacterized protein LOC131958379 n=1 Tax=Physella acuta TaxID=109671 RepID=UPI0027DE5673|nr:uncharacterized protein LOC131958379 [Physella acuta]